MVTIDGLTTKARRELSRVLTGATIVGDRLRCPRTATNAEILRSLGYSANSGSAPIARREYSFAFKTEPFAHQRAGFDQLKDTQYYAILWEMGLGKAKLGIDIAAYKFAADKIDALLVVTLRGVHRNWVDKELPQHCGAPYVAAAWSPTKRDNGVAHLLSEDGSRLVVATINFDAIWRKSGETFIREFCKKYRVMMLVDESQGIKSPTARRTKALLKYSALAPYRYIMTGTPVLDSPLDVWTQFQFLDPSILHAKDYWVFKRRHAVEAPIPGVTHLVWRKDAHGNRCQVEEQTRVVVGYKDVDVLRRAIDPHITRYTKDVLGLPPKVYRTHTYELSSAMQRAYRSMVRELIIELADSRYVTAQLAITKLLRLRQLLCGFVCPDGADGLGVPFEPSNTRIASLIDVLEGATGKCIIWATFRYSINEIVTTLQKRYSDASVVEYSGRTSDDDRAYAIRAFQDGEAKYFVGQQSAGGTGITLTAARNVVYFNNDFSLGLRLQSEDRAHRIGQTESVVYTDLEAYDTVDVRIIEALRDKMDLANLVTGDVARQWLSKGDNK